METRTIRIDADAYDRLTRARLHPDESFSQVIRRAWWEAPSTAAALLRALEDAPPLSETVLERLDRAQASDALPVGASTE